MKISSNFQQIATTSFPTIFLLRLSCWTANKIFSRFSKLLFIGFKAFLQFVGNYPGEKRVSCAVFHFGLSRIGHLVGWHFEFDRFGPENMYPFLDPKLNSFWKHGPYSWLINYELSSYLLIEPIIQSDLQFLSPSNHIPKSPFLHHDFPLISFRCLS